MAKIDIKIECDIDEPVEKIKKRVQHMIAKWPLKSIARVYVTAVNE